MALSESVLNKLRFDFFYFGEKQDICGNHIKAGFFNVIIQYIAVHGTND